MVTDCGLGPLTPLLDCLVVQTTLLRVVGKGFPVYTSSYKEEKIGLAYPALLQIGL